MQQYSVALFKFDELSKKDADQSKLVKEFIIESAEPASVEENKGEEE
jgi:hypothetical protein